MLILHISIKMKNSRNLHLFFNFFSNEIRQFYSLSQHTFWYKDEMFKKNL